MNKYQQAYQNIQVDLPTNNKDILVLRELVEKATPKKIEIEKGKQLEKCPNCGKYVYFSTWSYYCQRCGQRLDWSKEDE